MRSWIARLLERLARWTRGKPKRPERTEKVSGVPELKGFSIGPAAIGSSPPTGSVWWLYQDGWGPDKSWEGAPIVFPARGGNYL